MARILLLCCFAASILPSLAHHMPPEPHPDPTDPPPDSAWNKDPETPPPGPTSSIKLVTTAKPTNAPWSISYAGYAELPTPTGKATSPPGTGPRFHPDGASPDFYCEYPTLTKWEPCNSADSRHCWLRKKGKAKAKERCSPYCGDSEVDEINIQTDYENPAQVPPGIIREYWLELDGDVTLRADGFEKTSGKVFNQSFPGPMIEACWGDEVVIHVKNNYDRNGTTVHWHGIRQLGTNQHDGVNGVTQCPIAKGDSYTYRWRALQYGNTWYHSHYALQYGDGAVGPLVLYGPSSANWDVSLGSVLVQDYVHETVFVAYEQEKSQTSFARANSIVVNGIGHDPATGTGDYFHARLTPGKRHLIRLVNSAVGTTFIFSIDNHPFQVVANDLVAIEPYTTTSLAIGIGQRYTIIVEANQAPTSYWIRTHPATRCNGFAESLGTCNGTAAGTPGVFDDSCVLFDVRTAIASYDNDDGGGGGGGAGATRLPASAPFNYSVACVDEPAARLRPAVPWRIDDRPANNITRDRFALGRQDPALPAEVYLPGGYQHWQFVPGKHFWIDFGRPTLLNTSFRGAWDGNLHIVEEPYNAGFIFMIMEAAPTAPAPDGVTVIPISHPVHWHGHDVVVLAQNQSQFSNESFASFNFVNPPRRDTVLLPEQGYLVIAFRADNPGCWLVHCHIGWHSSSGLAMQNLESQDTIVSTLGGPSALEETERVCANWRRYNGENPILQDESGV